MFAEMEVWRDGLAKGKILSLVVLGMAPKLKTSPIRKGWYIRPFRFPPSDISVCQPLIIATFSKACFDCSLAGM